MTDRLQPTDERGEGVDLGASPNSDKSEEPLRFNSASSCLLSECALKVFGHRNPSKLNTLARWNHSSNGHHQRMSVSVVEPIATFSCSRTCMRIYSYDLVR
jgi:hypothetical protein